MKKKKGLFQSVTLQDLKNESHIELIANCQMVIEKNFPSAKYFIKVACFFIDRK